MDERSPVTVEGLANRLDEVERRVAVQEKQIRAFQEIALAVGSTLHLDQLLDIVVRKVAEILDAERSTLFLMAENRRQLTSKVAMGDDELVIKLEVGQGIAGWVAKTGRGLNIKDAYKDPRFNPVVDTKTGFVTRSILAWPLKNYVGHIIGVLQVLNKGEGYFTLEDEQILQTIGVTIGIALENSKLYNSVMSNNLELTELSERLRRKMDEIEMLYRIEQSLSRAVDQQDVLDTILVKTVRAMNARAGTIYLKEESSASVAHLLTGGSDDAAITRDSVPLGIGIGGRASVSGRAIVQSRRKDKRSPKTYLAGDHEAEVDSVVAVPIKVAGAIIGAMEAVDKRGPKPAFKDDDQKLLTLIAGQAGRAIERTRALKERADRERLAAIGTAVSSILHDIKNPMGIISGYVQLMAAEGDREVRRGYMSSVLNQFKQLKSMTAEVLEFARGRSQILVRKVLVDAFVSEVTELMAQEVKDNEIALEVTNDYHGSFRMDDIKLKRVFFNIARNAKEAMPQGGRFSVVIAKDDGHLRFTFSDTGVGIPEEIRDRVFNSFTTSGKEEGTGLGLAIVKRIVDQHEGTISFSSERGKGTTFVISLPDNAGQLQA